MDSVHLDDHDYNRLMDEIVGNCAGDITLVISEITRLGLHRSGVGRCPSLDEAEKKKKKPDS